MRALVIPVEGPVRELDLAESGALAQLQEAVGGLVQPVEVKRRLWARAVDARAFTRTARPPREDVHACDVYVNEDAAGLAPNMRATDFVVPGVSIPWGDCLRGDVVVVGFDPAVGEHRDVPAGAERRVRLVESEAGR